MTSSLPSLKIILDTSLTWDKTERDGSLSLSENDFNKAFANEPILFDVMINSLARSNNPSVKLATLAQCYSPKVGSTILSKPQLTGIVLL